MQASHVLSTFCRYALPVYGSFAYYRDLKQSVSRLVQKGVELRQNIEQTPLSELGENPYIWQERKLVEIQDELSTINTSFKYKTFIYAAAIVAQLALTIFLATYFLPAAGFSLLGRHICKRCIMTSMVGCLGGGNLGLLLIDAPKYYRANRASIQDWIDTKVREKAKEPLLDRPLREVKCLLQEAKTSFKPHPGQA